MQRSVIWGGAAPTLGNKKDISLLRAEHKGSIAVMILLFALQSVLNLDSELEAWVDNAEVI